MPKTYWTPSASRHSTKTSDALRSLTPPPYVAGLAARLTRGRRRAWTMRTVRAALTVAVLMAAFTAAARADGVLYIRGGGNGHGVGMSQYGAYGYALHGADAGTILRHYYSGTSLASTDPHRVVRVLLATGAASFTGASSAGHTQLRPDLTYQVISSPTGALTLRTSAGKKVATYPTAPLTASGPAPIQVVGHGAYRGSLQFSPAAGGGVQTVNAVGLDDYVRGVVAAEMPAGWAPAALQAQ